MSSLAKTKEEDLRSKKKLAVGDVVLCWFPLEEAPGEPGPKARPCIVVNLQRGNVYRRGRVEVMFGTTSQKKKTGQTLRLFKEDDLTASGLDRPSKFLLSKRASIPLCKRFIGTKLGHLPEHLLNIAQKHITKEDDDRRLKSLKFGRRKQQQHLGQSRPICKRN